MNDIEQGKKAREPVARLLKEVKEKSAINFKLLGRIVDYQLFDIERGDIQTMKELEVYAENTRSLMLYMNLHLLGVDDHKANKIASHLGRALGICDVIKKTPYYLAVRRGYIPTEILLKHNLFYDRIWSRVGGESIIADEFFDVLLELGAYARKHVEEARLVASQEELKPHCHRAFLLA